MNPTRTNQRIVRIAISSAPAFAAGFPLILGWSASLFFTFGRSTDRAFFEVMATGVLPILLVAAIVEWGLTAAREAERDRSALMALRLRRFTMGYGILFLVGEGAAAYAVAANTQTTFLTVSVAAAAALLALDIVASLQARLVPGAYPHRHPSAYLKKLRARRRRVEQYLEAKIPESERAEYRRYMRGEITLDGEPKHEILELMDLEQRLTDLDQSLDKLPANAAASWQIGQIFNALLDLVRESHSDDPVVDAIRHVEKAGVSSASEDHGTIRTAVNQLITVVRGD